MTGPKRTRAPAKKKTNGSTTIGRPSMFPGKNRARHQTIYMTDEAWALADKLASYHAGKVDFDPSPGDICEDAIRARAKQVGVE